MVAFFRLQDECDGEDPSLSFCVAFTLEAGKVESSQNGLRPASLLNLNHI